MSASPHGIVILGAGAIGRGFIPWLFPAGQEGLIFVDANAKLTKRMAAARDYRTYMVKNGELEERVVKIERALSPDEYKKERPQNPSAVFISVGPRNVRAAAALLEGVRCPVIVCENDPATVDDVRRITGSNDVHFAVPDVITSNTASSRILENDELAVVTEDGTLFVERPGERAFPISDSRVVACSAEELAHQWTAKLYLHNTPHCVAAYLGALVGVKYVDQALAVPEVAEIVRGSMDEMAACLKLRKQISPAFIDTYAQKELARFSSGLLCDPIARVAREPLRKLEPEGRLIGAAQMCLSLGVVPTNVLVGICSALVFHNTRDFDRHLAFMRRALPPALLLSHVLNLKPGEALELMLRAQYEDIIARLDALSRRVPA